MRTSLKNDLSYNEFTEFYEKAKKRGITDELLEEFDVDDEFYRMFQNLDEFLEYHYFSDIGYVKEILANILLLGVEHIDSKRHNNVFEAFYHRDIFLLSSGRIIELF